MNPGCHRSAARNEHLLPLQAVHEKSEYGDHIKLHWIAGKDNVLAGSASRNPEDSDTAWERSLSVLGGPVKRVMKKCSKEHCVPTRSGGHSTNL